MAQTKAQLLGPVVGDVVMDVSTLSLDAEGNKVGIGHAEPDLTLHVSGVNGLPSSSGSTPTGHLTIRNKAGSSHGMFIGVSDAQPWSSWIQAQDASNNATNYPLLLNPNGGNIGIGTNSPLSALHVKGPTGGISARFTDAVNATVFVSHPSSGKSKIADSGGNYGFEFDTASVNILSSGTKSLSVNSDGSTTMHVNSATHQTFRFTTQGSNQAKLIMRDDNSNEDIVLNTGSSTYFNNDYNFGLGISTPSAKLHIQRNSSDTDFTNETTPSSTSGVQIANLATGAGTFTSLTLSVSSGIATQNASVIAKATSSGTAPELHFTQRSGNNTLSRLTITSGGQVLINDTTVSTNRSDAPLQIETGSSGNALNLRARSSDNIYSYLNFQNNAGSQTAAHIFLQRDASTNAGTLIFGTASANANTPSERLYITSGGNLGVGNDGSFPIYTGTNDRTLILGTGSEDSAIQIHSGTSNYGGIYFGDATSSSNRYRGYVEFKHGTSDDFLRFGTAAQERLRITSDGAINIGVGNESSAVENLVELYVGGNNTSHATIRGKYNRTNEFNRSEVRFGVEDNSSGLGFLAFATGNNSATERLRITSGGYVGINLDGNGAGNATLTPWTNLHVVGANVADGVAARNNATPTGQLHVSSTGWGHNQGGTISLGSEPDNVNPNAAFGSISARREGTLSYQYAGYLAFNTSNGSNLNERLRITSGGNVNIGGNFTQTNYTAQVTRVGGNTDVMQIKGNSGNSFIRITDSDASSDYSLGADDAVGGGGFTLYDRNASAYRLVVDDSGRLLQGGMLSSLLGSSNFQLMGSGGPAKIAGYKSDNNPAANASMLMLTGYSQSGSTFTGIGEIDVRVEQTSNTQAGHHPGSIVTRVNGGSASGSHGGYAYSFAGLKDRERITHRSKRYYCLPDWQSSDLTYNNYREEWDYQHLVGYNTYSWYRFTSHSSSSSRGGSVDIRVTWSSRHASGNGYGHYAFHWRDSHANNYMEIGNVYKYHQHHLSGSYYGWASSPQLDVYEINSSGNTGGFYLRVQGHVQANSSTYDGGVMQQFTISAHTNSTGSNVNNFEFVGNSTPSDVGSLQGLLNLP